MTRLGKLLKFGNKVFSVDDLAVLWNVPDRKKLWESIKYYIRSGRLRKLYSGVYALEGEEFSEFELAVKLVNPAYISFHTALGVHGINFQHYGDVHAMALVSKEIEVNGQKFVYHQLKKEVFFDDSGLDRESGYTMASPERAVCDSLYLVSNMAFDNLSQLDAERLVKVSKIYGNAALEKRVMQLVEEINNA